MAHTTYHLLRSTLLTLVFLAAAELRSQPLARELFKLNDIRLAQELGYQRLMGISRLDAVNTDTLGEFTRIELRVVNFKDSTAYKPGTVVVHGVRYYVVEGDLLLTESEYLRYALDLQLRGSLDTADQQMLIGQVVGDRYLRWPVGYTISYAVVRASFNSAADYQRVVANMARATKDWEAVCGVHFEYRPGLDGMNAIEPPDGLTFLVMQYNASGAFIARSFFPNDPARRRQLLIDPSYYTCSFDSIGVLRHELGHVLGWRHEHIRAEAPPQCHGEVFGPARPLTPYDPHSVMHYFCGGMGSIRLEITAMDRQGAALIYGPPLITH